jgi:hypothetical protein
MLGEVEGGSEYSLLQCEQCLYTALKDLFYPLWRQATEPKCPKCGGDTCRWAGEMPSEAGKQLREKLLEEYRATRSRSSYDMTLFLVEDVFMAALGIDPAQPGASPRSPKYNEGLPWLEGR